MIEERKNPPPITQKDLKELVDKAIGSGVLDISNCTIDFEFNLAELLLESAKSFQIIMGYVMNDGTFCLEESQLQSLLAIPEGKKLEDRIYLEGKYIKCPFKLDIRNTCFSKDVSMHTVIPDNHFIHDEEGNLVDCIEDGENVYIFFEKGLCFENTAFLKIVSFQKSVFGDFSSLIGVDFREKLRFEDAIFKAIMYFEDTAFVKHTSFKEIKVLATSTLFFKHLKTHDYFGIIPSVLNGEISITDPALESDKCSIVVDLDFLIKTYVTLGKVTFENIELDNDSTFLKILNLK